MTIDEKLFEKFMAWKCKCGCPHSSHNSLAFKCDWCACDSFWGVGPTPVPSWRKLIMTAEPYGGFWTARNRDDTSG